MSDKNLRGEQPPGEVNEQASGTPIVCITYIGSENHNEVQEPPAMDIRDAGVVFIIMFKIILD